MEFRVTTDKEAYNLEAFVKQIGQDFLVAIYGGEKPHIGAVSVAQPRASLKDPEVISATASVICLPGHKEDELVKATSEILAAALNTSVVVTAGIHWDDINEEGIGKIIANNKILVDRILETIVSNKR